MAPRRSKKGQLLQIGSVLATGGRGAYGGSALGDIVGQGSAIGAQSDHGQVRRDDELEADKYGMKYMKAAGYDLQSAVALQELFVRKFEEGKDQDWMSGLFASPSAIANASPQTRRRWRSSGGPGGDVGAGSVRRGDRRLKKDAPALREDR
jgi:predicted Zn-dependent protease